MKDSLIKQSPSAVVKSGTKKKLKDVQKEKKNCVKRPKESKTSHKNNHNEKVKKVKKIDRKVGKKAKEHKSKKSEKKISRTQKKQKKKVGRKKNVKEQKTHLKKSLKTGEVKRGRKRKLTDEATESPPNKMSKTIEIDNSMLINGTPKIVPQITRSPWVLKLDVSSPSNNSVANDCKNAIKKSVFYIPKKNAMSSIIMKSNLAPVTGTHVERIGTNEGEVLNGRGLPNTSKSKTIPLNKGIIVKKVELDSRLFQNRKGLPVSKKASPSTKALVTTPVEPTKISPRQRMASLDALAKMHVICTTDRKPALEPSRGENDAHRHSKIISQHMESRFDLKGGKLDNNFSSQLYRSKINYSVKGKQETWKFVSQSVEESSISPEEESLGNLSSLITQQHNQETVAGKRKRGRPKLNRETQKNTSVAKKSKLSGKGKNLPPVEKGKDVNSTKSIKADISKAPKKISVKGSTSLANVIKKGSKEESQSKPKETKSQQLKVRETFRMRKTCTYQSVTLNSHEEPEPSDVNTGQIGVANYTKLRKTNQLTLLSSKQNGGTEGRVSPNTPGMGVCCYGSNMRAADKPASPSPRQPMEAPECCACHSPSRIPMAHVQSCPLGHRIPLDSHFDSNYHMHRFQQQQHLMYSHPSPGEYSCCCGSCLMHLPYPPHLPSHSHLPSSNPSFNPEGLCCHHHGPSQNVDPDMKRQYSLASGCSSTHWHSWCTCCELDSTQHGGCPCQKNSSCITPEYAHQVLVPCDQSPLDLSRASSSISVGVSEQTLRPHCSNSVFHGDILHFKGSHSFSENSATKSQKACFEDNVHTCTNVSKLCSRDYDSNALDCTSDVKENPQLMQLTTNKAHKTVHIIRLRQHQLMEKNNSQHPSYTSSREGSAIISMAEGTSSSFLHQLDGCHHFSTSIRDCSREVESTLVKPLQSFVSSPSYNEDSAPGPDKSFSEQSSNRLSISKKLNKRKFSHGWCWEGQPTERLIAFTNDSVPCLQKCYPAMRHKEGDIIRERDCVLLKSGSKDTDLPFVAKIAAFWENPDDGEMMMSLLWYYRPEHTEQGRRPGQMEDEVFASKHRDVNSVACIEDKCYVLTLAEYCRYRAQLCLPENSVIYHSIVVPEPDEEDNYGRVNRLPPDFVSPEMVFFCRSVYDYRQKRILKNPM